MRYTPPRSACFRPEAYESLELYADREADLHDLTETIDGFVQGPGAEGRILIRGARGVGKSTLTRRALRTVCERWQYLLFGEADCARLGTGPEPVLRQIARSLTSAVEARDSDRELKQAAQILGRLAACTKVKAKEVRTWQQNLKIGVSATSKLLDTIAFEFGLVRAAGNSREVEEGYERTVDATFLRELIGGFLSDCRRADHVALLFIDNLDQAAYAERQDEVQQIVDLARLLLSLRHAVVVMTLRHEFVSRDLPKYDSLTVDVPGMDAAGLRDVAEQRIAEAAPRKQQALKDAGFDALIDYLCGWTDNPWGFLKSLAALDFARADLRGATAVQLRQVLLDEARKVFPRLQTEELARIGAAFGGEPSGIRSRAQLAAAGITDELRDRAASEHVLIPDWILDPTPQSYLLAPQLHFLAGSSRPPFPPRIAGVSRCSSAGRPARSTLISASSSSAGPIAGSSCRAASAFLLGCSSGGAWSRSQTGQGR
ncbi:MAG TPA: ATP-binding protein [Candidatus Nanopelagicales bacterium]|nr:ATP-binding protein [Candidatus Nanopelagicales bacterium]